MQRKPTHATGRRVIREWPSPPRCANARRVPKVESPHPPLSPADSAAKELPDSRGRGLLSGGGVQKSTGILSGSPRLTSNVPVYSPFHRPPGAVYVFKGQQHNCKPSPQGKEPEVSDVSSICLNPDTPQERLSSIPESEVPERATGSRTREELGPFARVPKFLPACRSERVGV